MPINKLHLCTPPSKLEPRVLPPVIYQITMAACIARPVAVAFAGSTTSSSIDRINTGRHGRDKRETGSPIVGLEAASSIPQMSGCNRQPCRNHGALACSPFRQTWQARLSDRLKLELRGMSSASASASFNGQRQHHGEDNNVRAVRQRHQPGRLSRRPKFAEIDATGRRSADDAWHDGDGLGA